MIHPNVFILLGDRDGCSRLNLEPVGVTNDEAQAKAWCERSKDAYYATAYIAVPFFAWRGEETR